MKKWLVVANSARARVLEETPDGLSYIHVADMVHSESRLKGRELSSDRAGQVAGGQGLGSAELLPRTDPREREHEHFASQIATLLNAGVAVGRCNGLVLVASNPFLGRLKSRLSEQAGKHVQFTLSHDYTALKDAELVDRLKAAAPQH
ncbi:MAG: host attachment protein [Leptothrix sp. (in: b-proteobacteria)]